MRPLALDEIAPNAAYERLRPRFRQRVIDLKTRRRVALGEKLTLVFENRETLRFQIQEMCRIERIEARERVQAEIDVYNALMPGDGELSATLFIEITDAAEIRPELDRLLGIDEHLALRIGDEAVAAAFDPQQMEEDRISAVHYLRFRLTPDQVARFADEAETVCLVVDHPAYAAETVLSPGVRRSLREDLAGEPAPLLTAADIAAAAEAASGPADRIVLARDGVRVVRPLRPAGPGHLLVEPEAPPASLFDADDALLLALQRVVREVAAEVVRQHGSCRIATRIGEAAAGGDAETGLRWHVVGGAA